MPAFVVIKVKYGDTLRRFNVSVNGEQQLDLNMEGLRQRICSLFNLSSDANFSLTYRDEDNDLVTLADDEDLHDVIRQGLNPVRITVDLKTDMTAPTSGVSSGLSSPPRGSSSNSQQKNILKVAEVLNSVPDPLQDALSKILSQSLKLKTDRTAPTSNGSSPCNGSSSNSQQNCNPSVAEVLNSVPEPLLDAFSKISCELSKAASSPLVADLLDGLSKMWQSNLNASHTDIGTSDVSGRAEGSDGPKQETPNAKLDASIDEGINHTNIQTPSSVQQSPISTQATREAQPGRPSHCHPLKGKNVYSGPCSHKVSASKSTKKNKNVIGDSTGNYARDQCVKAFNDSLKKHASSKKETSDDRFHYGLPSVKPNEVKGSFIVPPVRNFPGQLFNTGFSEVPLGSVFHKAVRCDGCGVLPITGPRFKSKVKHDYDLCSICFGRMGNDVDYTRLDFPLLNRDSWNAINGYHVPSAPFPSILKRPTGKHLRSRLDSRFILDVNILDGTVMAPLTPFTKIWRMRNNGALQWQRGLQLLWIGGDRFSPSDVVEIELPSEGVNVGKEIDIAADFVAPELPGRYVSYWRMADSSGQKFGQRVWVLIEVDDSVDLTNQGSPKLNLNSHPESTGALDHQVPDDSEPVQNVEAGDSRSPSKIEQIEDVNFPINDDLLVTSDVVCPTSAAASSSTTCSTGADNVVPPEASSSLPNPGGTAVGNLEPPSAPPAIYYVSNIIPPVFCPPAALDNESDLVQYPPVSCPPALNNESDLVQDNGKTNVEETVQDNGKTDVEETLLKELEEMGFKQIDLNKKVLRVNDYDLERSVDDLCGVSEWDPILEELREMGFEDKLTNKRLLAKNNGSITRVVMDLISGEKPE